MSDKIDNEREEWAIELYVNDRYFRDMVDNLIRRVGNYTPRIGEHMIGLLRINHGEALIDAVELCLLPELINAKLSNRPISVEDAHIEFKNRVQEKIKDGLAIADWGLNANR